MRPPEKTIPTIVGDSDNPESLVIHRRRSMAYDPMNTSKAWICPNGPIGEDQNGRGFSSTQKDSTTTYQHIQGKIFPQQKPQQKDGSVLTSCLLYPPVTNSNILDGFRSPSYSYTVHPSIKKKEGNPEILKREEMARSLSPSTRAIMVLRPPSDSLSLRTFSAIRSYVGAKSVQCRHQLA